jgi:hypothetical protein
MEKCRLDLPNGVVWMTLLLGGFPFPFCCCCCLAVGALRRWSRLSVDPFRMARTFTEPRPGLQEPLVHVNLPPGAPGDAAIGCRLETTACCILATRTLADIVCSDFDCWMGNMSATVPMKWHTVRVCLYTRSRVEI